MPHSLFPYGKGDVLDTVVHQNIRLSDIIVSDILDQYYSTYWIMSKLGISRNLLKNSQIGNGFKALPLN
jgi:hypothetical protein